MNCHKAKVRVRQDTKLVRGTYDVSLAPHFQESHSQTWMSSMYVSKYSYYQYFETYVLLIHVCDE